MRTSVALDLTIRGSDINQFRWAASKLRWVKQEEPNDDC